MYCDASFRRCFNDPVRPIPLQLTLGRFDTGPVEIESERLDPEVGHDLEIPFELGRFQIEDRRSG